MSVLSSARNLVSVAGEVARFALRPMTVEDAKAKIRGRMAARERLFLQMVRETIWEYPKSPYRRLLEWADWSYEGLAESVGRQGVEATLKTLLAAGVYVTFDEFKGRTPIRRDGLVLECKASDFDNPRVVPSFEVRTSGTRSRGSIVPASLGYIADQRAPAFCLMLEAIRTGAAPIVIWLHYRLGSGMMWWLSLIHMGRPSLRWFSIVDPTAAELSAGHRTLMRLLRIFTGLRGARAPLPEHAGFSNADVVLDAVLDARRRWGRCAVITTPSAATRLAALAERRGIHLQGVTFLLGAEPLTPGKYAEIARSGAGIGVRYAFTEAGAVGGACGVPSTFDDVHLLMDGFALITRARAFADGGAANAFVFTSLLPSSPKVLFNAESDDFGEISERRCGCIWDSLGMHTHITNIRSFSKLTGEGMTLLGTDCVRILEEVLPREFGGRSIDYQLLEVEDDDHLTRLHLVVSPSVGPIDEARLLARFVEELRAPSRPRSFVLTPLWEEAGTIKVVRREPVVSAGGKLLPFHT
ncbi:MAG: hypothetical protein HY320_08120, partial [Armatimonadetes bacterium]|nr:hypothetical protein [Armatimonadota bacterium]